MEKEKDLFQDIALEAREQALRDHAYKSEEMTVNRAYSEDQLVGFKDELATESIALNELEIELKTIKDNYKAKMKPYVEKKKELLKNLKFKYEESFEEVFLLADQAESTMSIYDKEGKFLSTRRLYPQERQVKMIELNKNTGTNG